ncbi:MAG: serpin family protein [Synergistaceae bacterium]|jgi:serpin B|nr:serpin family protein [Synergistaceae bacterium]
MLKKDSAARQCRRNLSGGWVKVLRRLAPALALVVMVFQAAPALAADAARSAEDASGAVNLFAFDLYKTLTSENVFFSPYSVSSAMAMLYAGASGDAERELRGVMHYADGIHESMGSLSSAITGETPATLLVANAIWPDMTMELTPSYLQTVREYYGVDVTRFDFKKNWLAAEDAINKWVYEKTLGEISSLFEKNSLAPKGSLSTAIVLTNAVYFKSDWLNSFEAGKTKEDRFFGKTAEKNVPMMYMKGYLDHAQSEEFAMIRLPYKGRTHSMTVILPNRDKGIDAFEREFSHAEYLEYVSMLKTREMIVYLPKFDLDQTFDLVDAFKKMGLESVFKPSRDNFSNMGRTNDNLPLAVSKIVHKAKVKVYEEGTVAAAATGIGMVTATSLREPPPVFRADHPFIFFITDDRTGAILFMGRYAQP